MPKMKNRVIATSAVVACFTLLIILGILSLTTKSFVVDAFLHIYLRLIGVSIVIKVLPKCFADQLTDSRNKVLALCGCIIVLDLVVLDAIRYILSNGISTVLFLPISLPICFMIIMFYSSKDTGRDKKAEKRLTCIVGIPLLLLSLYFEILSFVQS